MSSSSSDRECNIVVVTDLKQYTSSFIDELWQTLRHKPSTYNSYMQLMRSFKNKEINTPDLVRRVRELLKDEERLLTLFNEFVPEAYDEMEVDGDHMAKEEAEENREDIMDNPKLKRVIDFINKIKMMDSGEGMYEEFLDVMAKYREGILTLEELKDNIVMVFSHHQDLVEGFYGFLLDSFLISPYHLQKDTENEEEAETNGIEHRTGEDTSIRQVDLSACKRVTHSYKLLPKEYRLSASQRTELDTQVLNDRYVSVKRDGCSFMKRKLCEEIMFQCEDDMSEYDVLLETLNASIKYVKEQLEGKKSYEKINAPVGFFRCVERIYGEHGIEILKLLKQDPWHVLHVILPRLKQKQEELSRWNRLNLKDIWKNVFAKNSMRL